MVSSMKNWHIFPLKLGAVIGAGLLLSACSSMQEQPEIIPDNEVISNDSSTTYPVPSYDGSLESPAIPASTGTSSNYYVVKRGDTIYSVASRYGRNYKDLASWNRLKAPYTLKQGQRLLVVAPNTNTYTSTPAVVTPSGNNYANVDSTTTTSNRTGYHTAQTGDTVYNIARRYQLSPHDIIAINALAPPYHLAVGQVVRLGSNVPMVANNAAVATASAVRPQAAVNGKQHVVRAGETLYSISRRYGYTPEEVAAWNRLPVPYTIGVGQVLLIAQPHAAAKKATAPAKVSKKSQVITKSSKHVAVPEPVTEPAKTVKPAAKTPSRGMITPSGSGRAVASFHTVQTGETLESIAASYHITTHDLAIWNGIGKPYTVLPGKKLLIVPP
jgi:LysM repeat protein